VIKDLSKKKGGQFILHTETWAKILYDLAAAYHHWQGSREILVSLMTPLYFARVASFVNQTINMSNSEAEKLVEEQADIFEKQKDYLIQRWDEKVDH
jgi:3-dehydroquinate dehydratase